MQQRSFAVISTVGLLVAAVFAAFPLINLGLSHMRLAQQKKTLPPVVDQTRKDYDRPRPELREMKLSISVKENDFLTIPPELPDRAAPTADEYSKTAL